MHDMMVSNDLSPGPKTRQREREREGEEEKEKERGELERVKRDRRCLVGRTFLFTHMLPTIPATLYGH